MPSHVSRQTCKSRSGSITRGGAAIKISALFACACAALVAAGAARSALTFGVSEDRQKDTDAAAFFATMTDLGLTQNRASISWDPAQPDVIAGQDTIAQWLPVAQAAGVRVVFAIAPKSARDITNSPAATGQFAAFVAHVAQVFPQVKDYVIGNEPNQPRFWFPQFEAAKPVAAAAYEPLLAQSYDALKAVDPTINVIGIGLSPRGNDNPNAVSNISRSPVRFLHDLGVAYRASGRKKPLMDELAFHPYPPVNTAPPDTGYIWPNAGLSNLDRVKQAVWDAFNGTAQPTFAEPGTVNLSPLRLELDEMGWQVAVLPALAGLYTGTENVPTIDEPTQAAYYRDVIMSAECDPTVRSLSFFLLLDEADLKNGWQSGLERVDASHRPSYDAVKTAIAQTHGNCQQAATIWRHTGTVVLPRVSWGVLHRSVRWTKWRISAGAGEEASYRAGIFKAGTSKRAIAKSLTTGRPRAVLRANGTIKARTRVIAFPARRLKRGRYVIAIRMQSTMNPGRAKLLISHVLRVG